MNRREFVKLSAFAIATPAFANVAIDNKAAIKKDVKTEKKPASIFKIAPYLQLLTNKSVEVLWITHSKSTGHVTWSQDGWKTSFKAWNEEDGLLNANEFVHRALIEGFNPAKPLEFKAHSRPFKHFGPYKVEYSAEEEVYCGKMRAISPSDGSVSWAMFNDVHENLAVYDKFMPHLKDVTGFCVFNGDIINHVDDQSDVLDRLVAPFASIADGAQLPVWYVRGNHETRGGFARNMRDYLALKDGCYYGAATVGNVRFVFLDCGEDKPDKHRAYSGLVDFDAYIARQNEWLKKEVASNEWKKAKARVAVRHIPMALSKWRHNLGRLNAMDDILKNANVTLGLGAHLHHWGYDAPTTNRPYPFFVGGGPGLGNPKSRGNATLIKCNYSKGRIKVVILDENGKSLVSEDVKI